MKSASDIVLKLLGVLLLTAAVLKGWQLLTEPMANKDIWTNRAFLIFTVEFELALGIWLLSGIFKKFAWLATLACFSMFAVITLYKGISGAESCGCFGSVHVNPWITLFAIDIPSILALAIFRPKHESETHAELSNALCHSENHACSCQECKCHGTGYLMSLVRRCKDLYKKYTTPLPSLPRLVTAICVGSIILVGTACVLAFNEPAKITDGYEVLEPETWVGKELPIIEYIDIGSQLKKGNWLVLFYHYDCPDCVAAINGYVQKAMYLDKNKNYLKIAFIEVAPFDSSFLHNNSRYTIGKLSSLKRWIISTPTVVLIEDCKVWSFWEGMAPDLEVVLQTIAM